MPISLSTSRHRSTGHDPTGAASRATQDEGCKRFITLDEKLIKRVADAGLGLRVELPSAERDGQTSLLIPGRKALRVIAGDGTAS
ncbi:hypothetical protein [Streptomyces clavifer]|uniref:hypothetical protein n=1 Tax=Streptomyces clavifer TaxID=68188 RepID=UPI00308DBFB7|nr:hypothetical protein OG388_05520 [Streptomyces clavifer]